MQRKKLGIYGILREAFRSLSKNWRLIVPIVLLVVVPLDYLRTFPTLNPPVTVDVTPIVSRLPLSVLNIPQTKRFEIAFKPIGLILSPLTTWVMVYLSVMAYPVRHFGLEELLSKALRTWKGVAITLLCGNLVTIAYTSLFLIFGALLLMLHLHVSSLWVFLLLLVLFILFILGLVVFMYLSLAAKLGLVVSAVEEGCQGLGALGRAGSLIRGRKLQGFALMVLKFLPSVLISPDRTKRDGGKLSASVEAVVVFLAVVIANLVVLCEHLVYTVYYHECKRSHGSGKDAGDERLYSLLPFASEVQEALP